MTAYAIRRTEEYDVQLDGIIDHIMDVGGIAAAQRFLDRLEGAFERLAQFPRMYSVSHIPLLAAREVRMMVVEAYVVFYSVNDEDKQVMALSVFDGRSNYALRIP